MSAATLSVHDLSWSPGRGKLTLLHPLGFELPAGEVLGIVGPNGAGKTTMLRALYRFHRPTTGTVQVEGKDIWKIAARDASQMIAAVLQEQPSDFALTVSEIVTLGRTPHRRVFAGTVGSRDKEIVEGALKQLELVGMEHRQLGTLSGGERQRVMVARALAQEPKLLILDEPTNHLDIRHQLEVLDLIRHLPLTIVTSLHDLNLAADVCDKILLLKSGRAIGFGAPSEVLTEHAVEQAFQVGTRRERLSLSDVDHLTFHLQPQGNPQ